ncbi:MAG TPA: CHRD domain-containing protein [Parafilimonas sp.]|nr:CHRD domain-containing protein [Parafilimonas sp.]
MKNLPGNLLCMIVAASMIIIINACNKDDDDNKPKNMFDFSATIDAAQETPPTGESGTGTCTATYDSITNQLSYTLTWNGLTGAPTAMHFHKADVGVPGDVEIPITGFAASADGTLTASTAVDQEEEHDLLEGKFYVNIHTAAHTGGEIRGQLLQK